MTMKTSNSNYRILNSGFAKYKVFETGDVYVQPFEYTYTRKDTGKTYTRLSSNRENKLQAKFVNSDLYVWIREGNTANDYVNHKLSRVVWSAFNGVSLADCDGFQIEFKDLNRFNCSIENLYRPCLPLYGEVWKDIHEYNDLYQVSNLGRVRRKPFVDGNGIKRIEHCYSFSKLDTGYLLMGFDYKLEDGLEVHECRLVHRIVATYFCDNPEHKPEVNHIDGNKSNNKASNLEWVTRSENELHAYRTGLAKPTRR